MLRQLATKISTVPDPYHERIDPESALSETLTMETNQNPITEAALIEIKAGQAAAFEAVFPQAERVISQAEGYLSHTLQRCIETQNRYLLLVRWTSVEAHTVGFRQSELFAEWRAIIGPFFDRPPSVEHYINLNQAYDNP